MGYRCQLHAATGETALTTAIKYDSHGALRLFRDHCSECNIRPLVDGPDLVDKQPNMATMLTEAKHFQSLQYGPCILGDLMPILAERAGMRDTLLRVLGDDGCG